MRRARTLGCLVLAGLLGASAGFVQAADDSSRLVDVTVERQEAGVTVLVKTTAPARYETRLIDSPTRLIVDLEGTFALSRARWTPGVEPIKEIRGSQFKRGTARVVLELTRKVGYRIEEGAEGLTVVLEPDSSAAADTSAPKPKVEAAAPTPVASDAPRLAPKPAPVTAAAPPDPAPAPKVEPAPAVEPAPKAEAGPKTEPAPKVEAGPKVEPAPVRVAQAPAPAPAPAAPAAQQPPGQKLISLDFKDADIINLLRILSAESGKNIVAGDDVKGRVSVSLKNVTWEQALETILEVKGLEKVEKGNVIRVVTVEQLTKEREAQARVEEAKRKAEIETRTKMAEAQIKEIELAARKMQQEAAAAEAERRGPLREETVRLSYADPEDVAKTLQGILGIPPEGTAPVPTQAIPAVIPSGGVGGIPPPAGPPFSALYGPGSAPQPGPVVSVSQDVLAKGITIRAHKPTNSVFIRHYAADLDRLKKLIREQLDVPLPQVKIEARMEILDRTALEAIGVQWGGAALGQTDNATIVGQGFQTASNALLGNIPVAGGVLQPDATTITLFPTQPNSFTPRNPNFPLTRLLPIQSTTGLPIGGNLVNLPIQALPGLAGALPAGGIAFGIVGDRFNINLALQALATQGKTRTLARPEIVTVENNKAQISLGEEIPYATVSSAGTQIQFKEALLKLEVTPTVLREKTPEDKELTKIKMTVVVENNDRGAVVDLGTSGSPPAINRRKAETLVLINEGERLVIGGVNTAAQTTTVRKVPWLGDIPIIGYLFRQKGTDERGRELVVFLTPSVFRRNIEAAAAAATGSPAGQPAR